MKTSLIRKNFDSLFDSNLFEEINKSFRNFDKVFSNLNQTLTRKNEDNEIIPTFENIIDTNLKEEKDKYVLSVPCENVDKDNIDVTIKNNLVKLSIYAKYKNEDGSLSSYSSIVERTIPENVDKKKIKANLKNNSLILTMPKLSVKE